MFDNPHSLGNASDRLAPNIKQEVSLNALRDTIASLTYRITEIQSTINKKIDRSECLTIFQRKVSFGHLKRYIDEVEAKFTDGHRQEEERNIKMQQIAIDKINQLAKKLKNINPPKFKAQNKGLSKQKLRRIQPQQLFLQSNETMFSLLVQEITKLQERQGEFDHQLQSRNKKIINLNNEVCRKIDRLQAEIEERLKLGGNEGSQTKLLNNSWSQLDRNNKVTVHKGFSDKSNFQSVKLDLLQKNIEALQKQVLAKMNIKDILPIVRQNTQPLDQTLQELRVYVEQSMDSTRKILASQTEINREMSLGARVGWWLSYEQENEIAIINKELVNLLPEVFEVPSAKLTFNNYVTILHQGIYILRLLPLYNVHTIRVAQENSSVSEGTGEEFEVMIGTDVRILGRESALRLQKNTQIRVIMRSSGQILLGLQKL